LKRDGAPPSARVAAPAGNFSLMLANGTPMFCAGDEFLNTQHGNNNPYNQDNETTWLDWSLLDKNGHVPLQYMISESAGLIAAAAIGGGRQYGEWTG
jgi:pullulanase/glycogen debranching enzyme